MLRRVEAEDGRVDIMDCIEPFYPNFIVFYVLVFRSILIISLLLGHINRTPEEYSPLPLLYFHFAFIIPERVYHKLDIHF
jgi:hypothetical protein